MNKDARFLRQLAVPLLLFALCVAVQRSDSAVSAANAFFYLQRKRITRNLRTVKGCLPPPQKFIYTEKGDWDPHRLPQ